MGLFARTKAWLTAPITEQLDPVHVFLLLGLVIIASVFWAMVVRKLESYT